MFVMGFLDFETNRQIFMLLIISGRTRCSAVQSLKTGVYTVQLKTKWFTSNIHLFAGCFGGHIVQTANCAFYLWLLDMAERYFNNLTVS
jgi:hypothetical protein